MTSSQSPHPNSNSPSRSSAFQWPEPNNDISVKEIIAKYYPNNQDLLKHALMAKAEEDKKQTAQDILKTEQARLYLRHLDIELVKEQHKLTRQPLSFPPVSHQYYTPVQQQALARITGSADQLNIPYQAPSSPVAYPHSAHPLCPDNRRQYLLPTPSQQPSTPISPGDDGRKRSRGSISYNENEDKLSHNKVMEALKAKIQRTSSSPLATTAPSTAFNKRQRTLPKPTATQVPPIVTHHPSTPSPRSAKPILPPIDTSIGRIPTKNLPSHPLPPPLSPIQTSSPPHAAISSIRSSHALLTTHHTTPTAKSPSHK